MSRDDKGLESRPGKGSGDSSQEGRLGGDLIEIEAVETVLLTLLANDR